MKPILWCGILLLAGCAPQAIGDRPVPATASRTVPAFPTVQAIADAAVREGRVAAISIAIGVGDAPTTFISAGKPTLDGSATATPDTLWRIYSMTKPITGIAAMILVDDGRLKLDQPVSDFIPEFASSRVLVDPERKLDTRVAAGTITVRHLLTHSSGLNYGIAGNSPAVKELQRTGVVPFQLNRAAETQARPLRPASLQEFARRAGRTGLIADPGTRFAYSMGLDVLAAVVEKAAGMPFETFVQRRLLGPLGMTSTYWRVPQTQVDRFATNYVERSVAPMLGLPATAGAEKLVAIDAAANSVYLDAPSFPYGGAGLVSSARDYDRFLHMLQNDGVLDGVRILRARTARLAKSNLLPNGVVLSNFGPIPPNEPTGFGAGGFVTTLATDGFGRHRGTFGWDGAAGTRGWTDPSRRLRVTTMINIFGAPGLTNEIDMAVAADFARAAR